VTVTQTSAATRTACFRDVTEKLKDKPTAREKAVTPDKLRRLRTVTWEIMQTEKIDPLLPVDARDIDGVAGLTIAEFLGLDPSSLPNAEVDVYMLQNKHMELRCAAPCPPAYGATEPMKTILQQVC
jgi:hypothetical protein